MASTLAIPHFINCPSVIPGAIPGHVPGTMPPVSVSIIPQFNNLTAATPNGSYGNHPAASVQVPIVPVGGGYYNDGMEVVWHGEFSRLFSSFYPPHVWYLTITNQAPLQKWKFHRDSAKVRFCCQDCGNGWTSMKGRVTFWFFLDFENNAGFVQFKLYGQQCKKCNSGKFEYVMWYPEEVSKVMCNVYNKVGQTYYGFLQPPIRIDRRPGRPRNQHNSDLCQACRDGECDQGRSIKPMMSIKGLENSPTAASAPSIPSPNTQTSTDQNLKNAESLPQPRSSTVTLANSPPTSSNIATSSNCNNRVHNPPLGVYTTPVTLTPGKEPILTYSVVEEPTKSTPPTITANYAPPQNTPLPPVHGHYLYHPTSPHLVGGFPIRPPPIFSILPYKPIPRSDVKPSASIVTLTSTLEAATITDNTKRDSSNKLCQSIKINDARLYDKTANKTEQTSTKKSG